MAVIGKIRNRAGLVIGVIGVTLIVFILEEFIRNSFVNAPPTDVAVIAGDKVSIEEFEGRVQQITEAYKQNTQQENVTSEMQDMLRDQAWEQMVRERVMDGEFEKMGISVSPQELFDMVKGKDPHPSVRQAFTDPNTGQFDPVNVIRFLKNKDKDPATAAKWASFEKAMIQERISQKYTNLITQGLYVTTAQAKEDYFSKGRNAKLKYVRLDFNSIADSTVSVSDAEINQYYKEHEHEHKQEASRKVEYVAFDLVPTEEDKQEVLQMINKQVDEFKAAKDDSVYVRMNSDNSQVDNGYHKKGTLSFAIDSAMFSASVGTVVGPYFENGEFKLSKLTEVRIMPDSVKARHILLKPKQNDDAASLKARGDSVKKLIQGGRKFEELAMTMSEDPGSGAKGGDLGWFGQGQMVPSFNDASFKGKKGDMPVVLSDFGVHIIEILDQKNMGKRLKVSTVTRKLEPSTTTIRQVFAQAQEFARKSNSSESFEKTVDEMKLNKRILEYVRENDRSLPGLQNPRELIRWAYKAKRGEVGPKVFEFPDKYVVAQLVEVREKGVAPLEQVKEEMEAGAKKEKKATMLLEKMAAASGAKSIEEAAARLKTNVGVAENVSFAYPGVPGLGREPELVGTAFTLKPGVVSKPIKGEGGVYVIAVESFVEPPAVKEFTVNKTTLSANIKNRTDRELFDALKEKAGIEDNRGKIY